MSAGPTKSFDQSHFTAVADPSDSDACKAWLKESDIVENEMGGYSVGSRPPGSTSSASRETFADASADPGAEGSIAGDRQPDAAWLPNGAGTPWVEATIARQCVVSDESVAWMRAQLLLRQPRPSFHGAKVFFILALIAMPFVYILAYKSFSSRTDITNASMIPFVHARSNSHAQAAQAVLPKSEMGDLGAWPRVQLAVSTGAATHADDMTNAIDEKIAVLQPAPDVEKTTIAPEAGAIDRKSNVAADLKSHKDTTQVSQAQAGVWTFCAVNLIPSGQIAVQKATSYRSCISAGKKCAGTRRYADIQYFDRPTWTTSVPLEVCYIES